MPASRAARCGREERVEPSSATSESSPSLDQRQRGGLGVEHLARAGDHRRGERLQIAIGEGGVGDGLQPPDGRRGPLGLGTSGRRAHELLALVLLAQAVADVRHAGVEHQLTVALDDPDHRLGVQAGPVRPIDDEA